jgi:hypothetical protein
VVVNDHGEVSGRSAMPTSEYPMTGMNCAHCEAAVHSEAVPIDAAGYTAALVA